MHRIFVFIALLGALAACHPIPDTLSEIDGSKAHWEKWVAQETHRIERSPHRAAPWARRGFAYFRLGHLDLAEADLAKALVLDSTRRDDRYNYATVLWHRGQISAAGGQYAEVVMMDSLHMRARVKWAYAVCQAAEWDSAMTLVDAGLSIDSSDTDLLVLKGQSLVALSRYEEADSLYSNMIARGQEEAQAYGWRGLVRYEQSHMAEALMDLNESILLDTAFAAAWYYRGQVQFNIESFESALADFDHAIRLDSTRAPYFVGRGLTLSKLERVEEANASFKHARKLDPSLQIQTRSEVE
ncbi:tetratricopeptide repeat protein [Pontibacter sp. G13]|uniref:tetratricopeptide repeat protein n=1 Tax=Pontibacter sp. G13 TaxID=3074898 RepID=UPI00288AE586|nr:tetratricopeptide repeat protein [Pontibacter sp. G13]WNJ20723.1 tetratricopeptide repeat protein [Pontibacter sp. G13]